MRNEDVLCDILKMILDKYITVSTGRRQCVIACSARNSLCSSCKLTGVVDGGYSEDLNTFCRGRRGKRILTRQQECEEMFTPVFTPLLPSGWMSSWLFGVKSKECLGQMIHQ